MVSRAIIKVFAQQAVSSTMATSGDTARVAFARRVIPPLRWNLPPATPPQQFGVVQLT